MRSKRSLPRTYLLAVKEGISDGIRQPGSLGSVYETVNAMLERDDFRLERIRRF
jgi:hypothetical protein